MLSPRRSACLSNQFLEKALLIFFFGELLNGRERKEIFIFSYRHFSVDDVKNESFMSYAWWWLSPRDYGWEGGREAGWTKCGNWKIFFSLGGLQNMTRDFVVLALFCFVLLRWMEKAFERRWNGNMKDKLPLSGFRVWYQATFEAFARHLIRHFHFQLMTERVGFHRRR